MRSRRLLSNDHKNGSWCSYVYDGELEGQMTFLTDANKRLIKVSDIYPEDVQLGKGDYIIRAQLRHDDTGAYLTNLLPLTSRNMPRGLSVVGTWCSHSDLSYFSISKHAFPAKSMVCLQTSCM